VGKPLLHVLPGTAYNGRTMTSPLIRIVAVAACGAMLAACAREDGSQPLPLVAGALPDTHRVTFGATASGYKLLYLFKGGADGATPFAGLTPLNGALYGVAYGNKNGAAGLGTVFEVTASGKERVLYRFRGQPDGARPAGNLIAIKNVLYGTTYQGGAFNFGSVFSITTSGEEHVIHSFQTLNDAQIPAAGLIAFDGMLYGTTILGGSLGYGAVYAISTSGKEHVVYSFKGFPNDGSSPFGSLVAVNGELYGTTNGGGTNRWGTVFAVNAAGKERVVYDFAGSASDGGSPQSNLVELKGQLYGTAPDGGSGTVFSVSTTGKERLVYAFKGAPADGASPFAGLTVVNGVLYGTTSQGGANQHGSIFKTTTSGTEQMLYSFKGAPKDGADPQGNMTQLGGALYGTTAQGGVDTSGQPYPDAGSIFRLQL
jgi:uncharacterized repeat protein (TIGR03803 family)